MSHRLAHRIARAVLALTTLAGPAAFAQGSFEIGGFGSYTRFDRSLQLGEWKGGGARLTLMSGSGFSTWMLEAEGSYAQSKLAEISLRYAPARARLGYALPLGRTASFLLGAGAVRNHYMVDDEILSEWGYTGLAGFRLELGSFMVLRLDAVTDYIAKPLNETAELPNNINSSAQLGLSFPLWRGQRPEPREEPRRPEPAPQAAQPQPERQQASQPVVIVTAPPAAQQPAAPAAPAQGPDADRDGIADDRDICSATPAGSTVDAQGCPVYRDTDSDGVIDLRDVCPATGAGEMIDGRGCPLPKDSDRDGVADGLDRCPATPMGDRIDISGCTIAAPVAAKEPPPQPAPAPREEIDTDGDGVDDRKDKCPNTPRGTSADASGCPILFKNPTERIVTLRGVTFAPWKAELTPIATGVLDDVARQLIGAPTLKVEVAGHTDSGGNRSRNITLSLQRAEAVRAYLVMKGVPAERIIARGYGPDQPIASNAELAGRAMNRRVELRRID